MKSLLKLFTGLLLLFTGTGAIFGGYHLMMFPDGSSIQLSPDFLQQTPFDDYRIPGLILFVSIGLFSFFTLACMVFWVKWFPWFVIVQGAILSGWIVIQMIMIREVYYLHWVMGGTGVLLMVFGWVFVRMENAEQGKYSAGLQGV
jgi:hypothetical protein